MTDEQAMLEQCLDELENALSMGKPERIQQCRRWVAQAKQNVEDMLLGGETSVPRNAVQTKKKNSPRANVKPLYCLPQAQRSRKPPSR